ncbi:MAG: hypothetical protein ASARMPREDX12_002783 [Alectoria sarmentosa]|nr:MAG: hypothetical protein ASARMPREDX12_002783 [Alectoria sarmentosa]
MAPNKKIAHLAECLRGRLHGDIRDVKPDFVPGPNMSSEARVRFDQYVQQAIKKYGEKEVEKILQRFYDKVKDIDHEAELRVWEMIYGPERTFGDRAYKWGDKEEETYRRAQRVRATYTKIDNAGKEEVARKEQEPRTRRAREQEPGTVKARVDDGLEEKKKKDPQGSREQETPGHPRKHSTAGHKTLTELGPGAPAPKSSRQAKGDERRRERDR